ncbi:hypothetical protein [Vibrio maritimus]|uniref:SEL1-like repeat protein n=1 Tax=Vibrio maritimus TaxID=990268 RepID=UPI003736CE0F
MALSVKFITTRTFILVSYTLAVLHVPILHAANTIDEAYEIEESLREQLELMLHLNEENLRIEDYDKLNKKHQGQYQILVNDSQMIEAFELLAYKGNTEAMLWLANVHLYGDYHLKTSISTAKIYLEKAVELGSAEAMVQYGDFLIEYGDIFMSLENAHLKAIDVWVNAANSNDKTASLDALEALGYYSLEHNIDTDWSHGIFKLLADEGESEFQYQTYKALWNKRQYKAAFQYLELAALDEHVEAMEVYAKNMRLIGKTKKVYQLALQFNFQLVSLKHDVTEASKRIAKIYYDNPFGQRDYNAVWLWSYYASDYLATQNEGLLQFETMLPSSKAIKVGLEELIIEAQNGDVSTQLILANLYERGEGVEQDSRQAVRIYKILLNAEESFSYATDAALTMSNYQQAILGKKNVESTLISDSFDSKCIRGVFTLSQCIR